MKLLRCGLLGHEKPACLDRDGRLRDLSSLIADFTPQTLTLATLADLAKADLSALPLVAPKTRIGACVGGARNFYAVGLNYARHARETNNPEPNEPVLFSKSTSCIALNPPFAFPHEYPFPPPLPFPTKPLESLHNSYPFANLVKAMETCR